MLFGRNSLCRGGGISLVFLALVLVIVPAIGAMEDLNGLRSRVEARWAALIEGDFDKAYAFETPAYRALYNVRQYRGRYGNGLRWQQAKVVKTDLKSPGVATVMLEIEYSFQVSGQGMMGQRGSVTETWLWVDGQWWYQLQ
ncbi:MAG: hypothetical protein WBQ37_08205 [Candidatus Competibacter sp.]